MTLKPQQRLQWSRMCRWTSHHSSALTKLSQEVWGIAEVAGSGASWLQTESKSRGVAPCRRRFLSEIYIWVGVNTVIPLNTFHVIANAAAAADGSAAARLSPHCLKIRWIEVIYFLLSIGCWLQGARLRPGDHSIYLRRTGSRVKVDLYLLEGDIWCRKQHFLFVV